MDKKFKKLKGLSTRSAKTLKRIIYQSEQNEDMFMDMMDKKIDHYLGRHSRCDQKSSDICKNLPLIENDEAKEEFIVSYLIDSINLAIESMV